MPEQMAAPIDPVEETLARLAEHGHGDVDPAFIAAGWRDLLYPLLEENVGERLSSRMSPAELDEFELLADADDEDGASAWLAKHVPDYHEVVRNEFLMLIDAAVARLLRAFADQPEGELR